MATEKSALRGTASRMAPKKKQQISVYNKKQLLIMLKESNCHPKELQTMIKRFRLDDENIIKGRETMRERERNTVLFN